MIRTIRGLLTILFFFRIGFSFCQKVNTRNLDLSQLTEIAVGPGPEDMVVDYQGKNPRVIISCGDFRNDGQSNREGSLYSYDLVTGETIRFQLLNLPPSIRLFPHGISLKPGNPNLLYVINHTLKNKNTKGNSIIVFEVQNNTLVFKDTLTNTLLKTPNDLTVLPSGNLYVTNSGGFGSNALIGLFKLLSRPVSKSSNVVLYEAETKKWSKVVKWTWVANGIHHRNNTLYVVNSASKKLCVMSIQPDGSLKLDRKITVASGMDNIIADKENNNFFLPTHDSSLKLSKLSKKPGVWSPFSVYSIDAQTDKVHHLGSHNGEIISAVSSAVWIDGYLYLSQIYKGFILKTPYTLK